MTTRRPLKQLLDQADALIGATATSVSVKQASTDNEVSALADLLAGADASVSEENMDKIALSLNRVQAASEIADLVKVAEFHAKAVESGYTEAQIGEALSKLSAAKAMKSLPELVALGMIPKSEDKNVLPNGNAPKVIKKTDLTKSQGC